MVLGVARRRERRWRRARCSWAGLIGQELAHRIAARIALDDARQKLIAGERCRDPVLAARRRWDEEANRLHGFVVVLFGVRERCRQTCTEAGRTLYRRRESLNPVW
jgi:hypothetical protein